MRLTARSPPRPAISAARFYAAPAGHFIRRPLAACLLFALNEPINRNEEYGGESQKAK